MIRSLLPSTDATPRGWATGGGVGRQRDPPAHGKVTIDYDHS